MNIENIEIEKLIPYINNTRKHSDEQIKQIASSIKEFGFINPIIIDKNNGIIAGHGRLQGALKLKLEEVPCIRAEHLTEAQKKAYIIADNKLALNADWDNELLKIELEELQGLDFDLDLLGFDDNELEDLLSSEEKEIIEDEVPEIDELNEPKSKLGQIYQLGNHRLMCGDSTSEDDVSKLMNGQLADMVFTDPPYGVNYTGGHNKKKRTGIQNDNLQKENLTGLFFLSIKNAMNYTKNNSAFYVWYSTNKSVETFASFADLDLNLRAIIQWYKIKSGLGAFMSQYIPNCEPCIYAHKTGFSPQWYGPTDEKTVWEIKKHTINEFHPTQKPVELPSRAINNSSKKTDIVLDLFGGSGSTLIACEQLDRKCYMMELDPKYVDVIIQRWENLTGEKAQLLEGE